MLRIQPRHGWCVGLPLCAYGLGVQSPPKRFMAFPVTHFTPQAHHAATQRRCSAHSPRPIEHNVLARPPLLGACSHARAQNFDGSGGNGAALRHYEATGRKYPLVVKLGTLSPHGGDVFS